MNELDQLLQDAGARLRDAAPTTAETEGALASLADVRLDQATDDHRRRRWLIPPALLAAAAVTIALVLVTRPADTTIAPADTLAPSTPTTVASAPTTVAPGPTSAPASTPSTPLETTSVTSVGAAPWVDADLPGFVFMSCCGASRTDPPSPELTAAPAPLTDGRYPAEVVSWSPDDPTRLVLAVGRFVPCAVGVVDCGGGIDGQTFGPDETGVTTDQPRTLELTLDGSVGVGLVGIDLTQEPADRMMGRMVAGDGTGLATLWSALAAAYDAEIAGPLAGGASGEAIAADLGANPRAGFSSAREDLLGTLYFSTGDDAPALLLQGITGIGGVGPVERSGTAATHLTGIEVVDGRITVYVYAGFLS
ncbi:MAG: hypothetical protein ABW219_08825 [Ilumatobacteraceae bacterium]